jgi:hypothetical protein
VRRYERKRELNMARERVDELVPRADPGSREAMMEKRAGVNKWAAETEEKRLGGVDAMDDNFLLGEGDDSYQAMRTHMEQQQRKKRKKAEEVEELCQKRVQELSAKFNEGREGSWMDKLGIDLSGGPIKIAPRNHPE